MTQPVSHRAVRPVPETPPLDVPDAPPSPRPQAGAGPIQRSTITPDRARFIATNTGGVDAVSAGGTSGLEDAVDRCLIAARARYVVDGHAVHVAPQFRMTGGFNQAQTRACLAALAGQIGRGPGKIPMDVVGHVLAGRGSTDEIATVTRALLEAGRLPPAKPGERDETRVQRMMWTHGVGIDCAGYVQRAVATVMGKTRQELGLREPLDEDLGSLDRNRHFQKVALASARPGDVITLRDDEPGQPGHTVLVARHFEADGASMAWRFPPGDPAAASFLGAKRLEVYELDSSWGAGPEGQHGGVRRAMWIHDPGTGQWASFDGKRGLVVSRTPYEGHSVVEAYRPS